MENNETRSRSGACIGENESLAAETDARVAETAQGTANAAASARRKVEELLDRAAPKSTDK
jgi:hypothetical protein